MPRSPPRARTAPSAAPRSRTRAAVRHPRRPAGSRPCDRPPRPVPSGRAFRARRPRAPTPRRSSATARGTRRRADRGQLALERRRIDARLGTLVDEPPERRGESPACVPRRRARAGRHARRAVAGRAPARGARAPGARRPCARGSARRARRTSSRRRRAARPRARSARARARRARARSARPARGRARLAGSGEELLYDQPELAAPSRPYDQPERHACVLRPGSEAAATPPPAPSRARSPSRCCRDRRS